jgi:hypothetical protein
MPFQDFEGDEDGSGLGSRGARSGAGDPDKREVGARAADLIRHVRHEAHILANERSFASRIFRGGLLPLHGNDVDGLGDALELDRARL